MDGARRYIGADLGAGSGRVMLGALRDGRVEVEEVHRFRNDPVRIHGTLYWNFTGLLQEVQAGIGLAARRAGGRLDGIGVDTWGVDFGLLDRAGGLLAPPVHYRDRRTEGMMDYVFSKIPRKDVFEETGIQFMVLNTLYQVAAIRKRTPEALDAAGKLLLAADLVHYFLSGCAVAELTLATTSQMWNPRRRAWSERIIDALGIPRRIFPEIVPPGTELAPLEEDLARELGLEGRPPVIASASHDTASAIAAVPANPRTSWAYLSSGTWSLLGAELPEPTITPAALERNFTNEGGVAGTTRFLKNINGLWLVQECRRRWARDGGDLDYGELTRLASEAAPFGAFVLADDPRLLAPDDMPAAIRECARETGQPPPETKGQVVRCALESLALAYREVLESLEALTGRRFEVLHIVGGGSRNQLLNQLAADATGIPVLAGPVEATATGNILVQAMATGALRDLGELRDVVRRSVSPEEYTPRDRDRWDARYAEYCALRKKIRERT